MVQYSHLACTVYMQLSNLYRLCAIVRVPSCTEYVRPSISGRLGLSWIFICNLHSNGRLHVNGTSVQDERLHVNGTTQSSSLYRLRATSNLYRVCAILRVPFCTVYALPSISGRLGLFWILDGNLHSNARLHVNGTIAQDGRLHVNDVKQPFVLYLLRAGCRGGE